MDAGKLAEKVGPELNVLPISPSVDESGARAVKEGSPAALGESVSLVDVSGEEKKRWMERVMQSSSVSSEVK